MIQEILQKTKERMEKAEAALQRELGSIRAGRANASLLERVSIEYYGALTPLNQMAQISVPEARMLLITPYDKSVLKEMERAILQSDIGITPSNDGNVIRLVIPPLTEERRKELAKQVKKEAENSKVAIRNIRRDAIDELKKAEKAKEITEDELRQNEKKIQDLTDQATKELDRLASEKEKELLDV
ncbi:ribosome recycling factor [Granulicatella sp. zg-ZJ]|uniref:ribosome recycling factor n=1 Tax=unclassified Granulicatella TaxID=2630493 RepID=UPI0013C289BA|nr:MULTISPECIES: ribosome recycling factor [unclassified Granulicatella]NEW62667.1 ribosome recycling factor [Granulicatella sp. zg-ZJ]NEW65812.1 ribosome recycling factor [Granulicatella sp. zg-84]QMI86317.1 ribosome recycling factor [Carnobacteriaceae bacterium zg-84]